MLLEMFLFFEVVMITIMLIAFFSRQILLWAISMLLAGVLMMTSFNIETVVYVYNSTLLAYTSTIVNSSYPYVMGINMLFFFISLLLLIFDIWDGYGSQLTKNKDDNSRGQL